MKLALCVAVLLLLSLGCDEDPTCPSPTPPSNVTLTADGLSFASDDEFTLVLTNHGSEAMVLFPMCGYKIEVMQEGDWSYLYSENCDAVYDAGATVQPGTSLVMSKTIPRVEIDPDQAGSVARYSFAITTVESNRLFQIVTPDLEIDFAAPDAP